MNADTFQKIVIAVVSGLIGALLGFFLNRRFQLNRELRRTILPLIDSLRKAIAPLENRIRSDHFYESDISAFNKVLQESSLRAEHEQLPDTIKNQIESCRATTAALAAISRPIRSVLYGYLKNNAHQTHEAGNVAVAEKAAMHLILWRERIYPQCSRESISQWRFRAVSLRS